MRRLLALAIVVVATGCGKDPLTLEFDIDKDIPEQSIPGSIAPCQLPIPVGVLDDPFAVVITQEEDFPEQNTDVQHVRSARVREISLSIAPTSSEPDWDFLDAISLFVEAVSLERKLVASIGLESESALPIEDGATRLDLEPERLNLAPYIKANGGFTMTSEAVGCAPSQEVRFIGRLEVRIVADPL